MVFERATGRQLVERLRKDLNADYVDTDENDKPLSVTSMVGIYYANAPLDTALPTGLADRVATLSFSPAQELDRTKREFLRRLGGVPVAIVASYDGRFDFERVPVYEDARRAVQQSPLYIARMMPRLPIPQDQQLTEEEALQDFVISTVEVAETAVIRSPQE